MRLLLPAEPMLQRLKTEKLSKSVGGFARIQLSPFATGHQIRDRVGLDVKALGEGFGRMLAPQGVQNA